MSLPLQHLDIFELRPLITNLNCKLSASSEYDAHRQLLAFVSEENDIVLRFTCEDGQEVLKLISWFRRTGRVIHNVCFDPSGSWLLVLCFDNTLHIVPALAVVDKNFAEPSKNNQAQQQPFSTTQVTSFIIPFVGPHECPNSKKCPNHSTDNLNTAPTNFLNKEVPPEDPIDSMADQFEKVQLEENVAEQQLQPDNDKNEEVLTTLASCSHDVPENMLANNSTQAIPQIADETGNSQLGTSFMASNTCPYPLSVVWWQTIDGVNRAIIGYSDGSVCFVGLSPNCPFVASTAIEQGSVVKLLICKDNTFESVMLLITSSLKQQFKLLLEQRAIKYIYPGDISPSANAHHSKDGDWQIVMPLKSQNSTSSDPASDNSQTMDEDVFIRNTEVSNNSNATSQIISSNYKRPHSYMTMNMNTSQMPPPPPYSVAINRHLDSAPLMTTAGSAAVCLSNTSTISTNLITTSAASGVRFSQQQLPSSDLDDYNNRAGILPAARARLASLKSLGSKKLNAIKMRLSDNRQKLEEYMPENSLGSFAIMDSPSLTPEVWGNSLSFFTIQNLRNTYLLSALHCQSNSLSVHNIDINLKPLFFYKIPKQCFDILISSNLLYSIQYVDLKQATLATAGSVESKKETVNTEKENRDTDIEKEAHYAEEKSQEEVFDIGEDDDKLTNQENNGEESAATSAASSGQSNSENLTPSNSINAVGVLSSAMASYRLGADENIQFNSSSQLGVFRFEHETVQSLYQMATYRNLQNEQTEVISKEEKAKAFEMKTIRTPFDYVQFYETADNVQEEYSLRQMEIMQNEFPKINYDPCYVVTNRNVYFIQLKKEPFAIFLDAALAGEWTQCVEFCNTFDLNYEACIEFAGDFLLRRKKVTQALVTYNTARIKPIRTALKLAMFGQTNALMHLCAMALKSTYVLRSKYFCNPIIKSLLDDITYRHSEDVRLILPTSAAERSLKMENTGASCSDYFYGVDEAICNLQMSPSSQFHLANLLLITLAEKAVNDKNYLPLWNFLVTNSKYHTNMTSIVLCQSGLFSAALILAKIRGVCIDTFLALSSVVAQEFGWYTELNVCLYNMSESIFSETITYLPQISVDYFGFIQERLEQIRPCVLKRLEQQLNPFSAILRPIVSHTSAGPLEHHLNDNNSFVFEFCKNLIETYLAVLIHMESQQSKKEHIINALSTFRINYEDNQFAIESTRFKPISAGCGHCACVVDGIAYFWGSNGVPCNYSTSKSSEPPEPPHAVKSLDLLAQLNLEVHAVECGRQHTLVLTNNGLYAFGNNNLCQLGIGKQMQMSMQPMLVSAFDGKNVTILEAGQYHNAAVADGHLYTWGWGLYGQLGHGETENLAEPKMVSFFKYKKVIQISLGHAHSLVLCQGQHSQSHITELYVFGSNHFGQLGIGSIGGMPDDEMNCAAVTKSLVPIKLNICPAKIRLIHTKFFTNLAVDEHNRMYTWGSSPQALRLANQIKRRANAKQKNEENQRREMSKRFEDTISQQPQVPTYSEAIAAMAAASSESKASAVAPEDSKALCITDAQCSEQPLEVPVLMEAYSNNEQLPPSQPSASIPQTTDEDDVVKTSINEVVESNEDEAPAVTMPVEQQSSRESQCTGPPKEVYTEVDPCEHMSPHLVDTSEIAGSILQISSGLFHFALISSSCTLYTWGKNLEHQLGTEDKERRPVNKPSPIDSIERPMFVDCGADFTLVMTTDYVVKAFGGNSNGQCGRDLGASIDKMKQRVVCLPTTKRLMRFESQCVEVPVEINLPRPRIRMDVEPVRYLKSIPRYEPHFVQEATINFEHEQFERPSPNNQYKSTTTQGDSSENAPLTGQESDDLISSLENLSNNDGSSFNNVSFNILTGEKVEPEGSSGECSSSEGYVALAVAQETSGELAKKSTRNKEAADSANQTITSTSSVENLNEEQEAELQSLRQYIHYCLYVFHGLYNPDKIRDFSKHRLEYRIRTLMLNFKFVDAFVLCLQDCENPHKTLKLFEYFSRDTGYVPMRRSDLKYLIYYLMLHFLSRKFDVLSCERFFLADLDFYLLELAYVLFFNNNNTELEQNLNQKFKNLMASSSSANGSSNPQNDHLSEQQQQHKLEQTDVIFDSLSVKFKTIVCQRLHKHCEN